LGFILIKSFFPENFPQIFKNPNLGLNGGNLPFRWFPKGLLWDSLILFLEIRNFLKGNNQWPLSEDKKLF